MTPFLEVRGLTKAFGELRANDDVSFSVNEGEILGIVGENGAGKSTLVSMLAGSIRPDAGTIAVNGIPLAIRWPIDAQRAGIALVHQHFTLIEKLTVEENLVLGRPELRHGILNYRKFRPAFQEVAERLGTTLRFDAPIESLSVGGRQQVELVKALFQGPRLLILDEPTAVLPPNERDRLLQFVRHLKDRGTTTILISHKLDDLYACCDRAIVMRRGRVVGSSDLYPDRRGELVRLIVGAELPPPNLRIGAPGNIVLSVKELVLCRDDGSVAADRCSFDLRAGEIVGLCGVEGNGQTELLQALAGMRSIKSGEIIYRIGGQFVASNDAAILRSRGVGHIPEDRLRHATIPSSSLTSNWLLRKLYERRYSRCGWLRQREITQATVDAIAENDVRAAGPHARMSELSGGNQQKFVIGRELGDDVAVILAGHPTRGLDIRTVGSIRNRLLAARSRGVAILLLSADLAEIWDVSDRVMVMAGGQLRGPVDISSTSVAQVGAWMTAS